MVFVCDACGLDPIVMVRYRCVQCDNSYNDGYDLCVSCYGKRKKVHDKTHRFKAVAIAKKNKPLTERVRELEEKVKVLEELLTNTDQNTEGDREESGSGSGSDSGEEEEEEEDESGSGSDDDTKKTPTLSTPKPKEQTPNNKRKTPVSGKISVKKTKVKQK